MTINQFGGIFGRNPTFNDVTIEDDLTAKTLTVTGAATVDSLDLPNPADWSYITNNTPIGGLRFGTQDAAGVFSNQVEISAWGGYVKLNADVPITGNLVISTAGNGIDFSATSGTGTSELFDDYEEGTWTPVYTSTTNAADNVTNARVGYYTKIGNTVYATATLTGNDLSGITSTDQVRIGGLPFSASSTSAGNDQAVTVGQYRYLLTTDHTLLIPNAQSYVSITTDGFSAATYATFFQFPSSTGTSLKISMVYQAS